MRRNRSRNGPRGPRRGRRAQLGPVSLTTSKPLNSHADPRPVNADLRATQRCEVFVSWSSPPSGGVAGTVSIKNLVDTVAGGSALWDRVQFHRFDVYADERPVVDSVPLGAGGWPTLTVTMNDTNGIMHSDVPTFTSDAVSGHRRAHVGIRPSAMFQNTWFQSSNTDSFLQFQTDPTFVDGELGRNSVTLQFTCILRSTPGTESAPVLANCLSRKERMLPPAGASVPTRDENPVSVTETLVRPTWSFAGRYGHVTRG